VGGGGEGWGGGEGYNASVHEMMLAYAEHMQGDSIVTIAPGIAVLLKRTRCVRSGVRLLIFHMGTWGFSLGEVK